jgi:serine/threonine protein kinase
MMLAEKLRRLHEYGSVHGGLTPETVAISGSYLELLPAREPAGITPYSAPEVAEGRPADARSDIFSFGAVFYEMLTGRRAFDGYSPEPAPSGSPAIDRLVAACVAASPDARFQRVQKLMLELKLLASAARRAAPTIADAPIPAAPIPTAPPPPAPAPPPVAGPMREMESRISARLAEQERSVAGVAHIANEVLQALRRHQTGPIPPPVAPPRSRSRSYASDSVDDRLVLRLEQAVDAIGDRVARLDLVVTTAVERLQRLEQQIEAFDTDAAALRDSVTRDIRNFERTLKAQGSAIESTRTAMGQTDDLVERVVEALDSLQSMFVSAPDERLAS